MYARRESEEKKQKGEKTRSSSFLRVWVLDISRYSFSGEAFFFFFFFHSSSRRWRAVWKRGLLRLEKRSRPPTATVTIRSFYKMPLSQRRRQRQTFVFARMRVQIVIVRIIKVFFFKLEFRRLWFLNQHWCQRFVNSVLDLYIYVRKRRNSIK